MTSRREGGAAQPPPPVRRLEAAEVEALLAGAAARCIHRGPRGEVWRVEWEGRAAALKLDRPPSLRSRWGQRLRGSRAARALEGARALRALGFAAPEPLALAEEGVRSVSLLGFVSGPDLNQAWAEADVHAGQNLAVAAAQLCARLHAAGVRARDLKPPNLILSPEQGLTLIDLEDLRVARFVPARWRWRNLAALDAYAQLGPRPLGARARVAALRAYAARAGLDPRVVLAAVLPRTRAKLRALRAR